jgi:hypothetical protein
MEGTHLLVLTLMTLVILLSAGVLAQSDIPHQFAGSVTVNGAPAQDGLIVVAKVSGTEVSATATSGGTYGYDTMFFVPDPYRNREGKTIEFFVSGAKAGEYIFTNGGQTFLDLSATVSTGGDDDDDDGGSSRRSGGDVYVPPAEEDDDSEAACIEDWECTEWFECYNKRQTRLCVDVNRCGTEENKPATEQSCTVKICDAGEHRCDGDDLLTCSASEDVWVMTQTCENGCSEGECITIGLPFTGHFLENYGLLAGIAVVIVLLVAVFFLKFR